VRRLQSDEHVELDRSAATPEAGTRPASSIASGVRRGVSWKFLSQGVSFVLQLTTTVVLARLLTPRDFGLAAMVLVFRRIVMLFSDFALTPALVQIGRAHV